MNARSTTWRRAAAGREQRDDAALVKAVREHARPLGTDARAYDSLLEGIGDARFVLLGEASHGTHEFYRERAEITKRLVVERGFRVVAAEADWPDAYRANCYAQGQSPDADAPEALTDFRRFPAWMWRNTVMVDFLEWLRGYNESLGPDAAKAGFYGLDLYSLRASMESVMNYLQNVDPEAARRARERYSCFDLFGEDEQVYGLMTSSGLT